VNSVIHGTTSTIIRINAESGGVDNTVDGTTNKCSLKKINGQIPGFIATSPSPSIIKGIRIYTANNYKEDDPASYKVEGSNDGIGWDFISEMDINISRYRNAKGITINSTFEAMDPTRNGKNIVFENEAVYTQYRVTIPTTKSSKASHAHFAEIELPGYVECKGEHMSCQSSEECCGGTCLSTLKCAA